MGQHAPKQTHLQRVMMRWLNYIADLATTGWVNMLRNNQESRALQCDRVHIVVARWVSMLRNLLACSSLAAGRQRKNNKPKLSFKRGVSIRRNVSKNLCNLYHITNEK